MRRVRVGRRVLERRSIHGRFRLARRSFGDSIQAQIAAIHPDFDETFLWFLSLMEFAGRASIKASSSGLLERLDISDHGLTCGAIT